MKKNFNLFAACAALFLFMATVYSCANKPKKDNTLEVVSVSEMKELMKLDEVQVVDVRTKPEFESGHIKDAQNIVFDENFKEKIATLDKTKPIVVYCQKGGRSSKCAQIMMESGFQEIYDLDGGLSKWVYDSETIEKEDAIN
ncbi:MAG: rhodanese-like domain-containing protein [Leeuwenhoekiella sp.]